MVAEYIGGMEVRQVIYPTPLYTYQNLDSAPSQKSWSLVAPPLPIFKLSLTKTSSCIITYS